MSDTPFPHPAPPPPRIVPQPTTLHAEAAHASEMRRHAASKASAEAVQAWVIAVAIGVAGVFMAMVLAVCMLKLAALG